MTWSGGVISGNADVESRGEVSLTAPTETGDIETLSGAVSQRHPVEKRLDKGLHFLNYVNVVWYAGDIYVDDKSSFSMHRGTLQMAGDHKTWQFAPRVVREGADSQFSVGPGGLECG